MPLQATSGAASYDAFGGGAAAVPQYIEDVFSTYLYTGNGSSQAITNGIDLSTKGGLVWVKNRGVADSHQITDTVSAQFGTVVSSNLTDGATFVGSINTPSTSGFSVDVSGTDSYVVNESGETYASWTFRKQPKFFDIQKWTGSGANRTISHNLGSVPACILVKRLDDVGDWQVYHRSLANTEYLVLNTTAAKATGASRWNSTTPTSTVFSLGTSTLVNASGGTYVAYIFAHDAGGFGLTGTDNVITCGSVTANGSGLASINLGYEPQWFMLKNINSTDQWYVYDNMRGLYTIGQTSPVLRPNIANAEVGGNAPRPNATGVSWTTGDTVLMANNTYIYIAIRRGPMKVPTDATKVFKPVLYTGTGSAGQVVSASGMNPADTVWHLRRVGDFQSRWDRLRGGGYLSHDSSDENTIKSLAFDLMTGSKYLTYDSSWGSSSVSNGMLNYYLGRAPSFFDVTCFTTSVSNETYSHNLGVVPELIIVKTSNAINNWIVYSSALGPTKNVRFDQTNAEQVSSIFWNNTAPTSSVFTLGSAFTGYNIVAYLFATCAGVSKVGSYTGNGSTQTINCGFTGGARFVMIKKTNASSSWFVWDTSRGMVSGTDPRLFMNNPDGESNNDWVYTASTGFQIVTSDTGINASGSNYIFLAIA
jgi:hypothetical protein